MTAFWAGSINKRFSNLKVLFVMYLMSYSMELFIDFILKGYVQLNNSMF